MEFKFLNSIYMITIDCHKIWKQIVDYFFGEEKCECKCCRSKQA
jgi:hypothetical protein